jgi:small subunit ribosomal protein S3
LGAEVTISGKLRSERAHFEKHSAGMIPKSGEMADRIVKEGVTHVLTKMGMMGIRLKIALGNEVPQEFEYIEGNASIPESDQQEQTQVPDAIEVEAEKPSVNQGIKG